MNKYICIENFTLGFELSLVCILKVWIECSECGIPAMWPFLHLSAMFRCRVGWHGRVRVFYATLRQEVRRLYEHQFSVVQCNTDHKLQGSMVHYRCEGVTSCEYSKGIYQNSKIGHGFRVSKVVFLLD